MAILAGKELIVNEGFSKFSARKVAKSICYTVGTVYNIFGSHEVLILHINATTLEEMYGHILQATNKRQHVDRIKKLAAHYIEFAQKNYNSWSALFEFNLPQDIPLPEWYANKIKELFTIIEQALMPLFHGNTKNLSSGLENEF